MRQRAAARDAPSPIAALGSPLRDGSRRGCGAQPALLPRLLLFLLLLRAPVRPSRSAHGKRPPPRAAARSPARPRRPSRAAAPPHSGGAGWGSRAAARPREHPARAGQGPAARGAGPPSCRAWRGRDPGATRRGGRLSGGPQCRPPGLRLGSPPHRSAGPRVAPSSGGLCSQETTPLGPLYLVRGCVAETRAPHNATHSSLHARAEPQWRPQEQPQRPSLPLLDDRSFPVSHPCFLSKGCPHSVMQVPLLSTGEGL